ncbi:AAA family ATPase [Candidatus Lokiarchaeum ossiferum]|uniref:AAA family ATPase n=1 Tax=Candidatus Lokiarchaeum ossiferum TaxID=2951803 RepID=UPI00352CD8C1
MEIRRFDVQNFRSFGVKSQSIDLDSNVVFFVGKNHSGKSNLLKLLEELKFNNSPLESNHILSKNNWYNNETGVERPLKIRINIKLDEEQIALLFDQWFLLPIREILNLDFKDDASFPFGVSQLSDISYKILESTFDKYFPDKVCLLRIEFIRFSDVKQEVNYSIQFNNIILVNTADGRSFIQNLRHRDIHHYRESQLWDEFIWNFIQEKKSNSPKMDIRSVLSQLFDYFFEKPDKFIFTGETLENIYSFFNDSLVLSEGIKIMESDLFTMEAYHPDLPSALNRILAEKLNHLRMEALNSPEFWGRYHELQIHFQAMFEDLDLVFGIAQDKDGPYIKYYQTSTNAIITNFDSIGVGITEMLNFLYYFIVETRKFIMIDFPEFQLHPHSQRHLYNLIKEFSLKNKHHVVIITHSPYFFQPDDLYYLRLFELSHGITEVRKIDLPRNSKDYYRLKRNFSIRNRDSIFADGLIFVEGPSEEMAFPYFFRAYGLDLDLNNLSLINLHGKGSFGAFWKFARQLHKKYWFFLDNDALGVKAGDIITPSLFKRSIIYKNRAIFPCEISELCAEIILVENHLSIEFHEKLELLRNILHKYHVFILMDDFEGIFEEFLADEISFYGGKVEKSMQLVEYLKENEEKNLLPERLYPYIEIIQEELKKR